MDEKVIYSCVDQEHNTWNCRGCGYIETFEADGPVENGWNFCPGCGHEIEVEAVSPCPFDNGNCMCQFCEAQCNNGLNCSDCRCEGKPVHDIHLCTASSETSPSTFGTGCAITAGRLIPERVSGTYLYKLKEDKHMSELTLRFGEARLHVEGDADLVARERAAFLEHLGRLDRQSEKAGELLAMLLRAGRAPEKAEEPVSKKAEPEEPAEEKSATQDDLCRLRSIRVGFVSPSQLKRAKAEGKLDHLLAQRDEIEVPLDTGGTVTVVCCYVSPTSARFVFKDCWDEGVMNDEATNKTGYFKSKGRKHVLEDIYPHIAAEWREIIVPRTFVETIEGERVEYSDPLWLPSATDVFGTPDGAWWNDGDDDFQLPVFTRERDRVKECGDKGTYPWWLRSVYASGTYNFCIVYTGGSASGSFAYDSRGFAPGFDI